MKAVGGDPKEIKQLLDQPEWRQSFPCITSLCGGRLQRMAPDDLIAVRVKKYAVEEIALRGFYRAIHGFGVGGGAPASLAKAREILLTKRIVDLQAESVGQPERVILRQLIMEDGTRLHFDMS